MSDIHYSSEPGSAIRWGACAVRLVGWDHSAGWGPEYVQYRRRCDVHNREWSGGVDGCPCGAGQPPIVTIKTRVREEL